MYKTHKIIAIIYVSLLIITVVIYWNMGRTPTQVTQVYSGTSLDVSKLGPKDIYPNDLFTIGTVNPNITDKNINQTICNPHWSTKSIRPPSYYTTALKIKQMAVLGLRDQNPSHYEEDHFISLELGGNPTDPKNLWPEPYTASIPDGGAKNKDKVENYLHSQVCTGKLTLGQAQNQITQDWYKVYKLIK